MPILQMGNQGSEWPAWAGSSRARHTLLHVWCQELPASQDPSQMALRDRLSPTSCRWSQRSR